MTSPSYRGAMGGLPAQSNLMSPTDRAVVTPAYTFIPAGVQRDIVTMRLPYWKDTRVWVLARPTEGYADTFSQYLIEIAPGGGSERPEPDAAAETALFVLEGELRLTIDGSTYTLIAGSFAWLPPASDWTLHNRANTRAQCHWIRKHYQRVSGIDIPSPVICNEQDITPTPTPDTDGAWATTRFVDPDDIRHDMHVTIVTLQPGAVIPFLETHVMEHGLYVLQGKGVYRLNQDWVEVEAGDFMWLKAFCPQACYAGGPGPFRYLLYKDMHRHCLLEPRFS